MAKKPKQPNNQSLTFRDFHYMFKQKEAMKKITDNDKRLRKNRVKCSNTIYDLMINLKVELVNK
jgi:hypothetical protein